MPLLPFHGGNLRRFSTLQVLSVLKCPGSALPLEVAQGMAEGNLHNASKFIDVISGQALADVSMLSFRGPDSFVVGDLQNHFPAWQLIANIAPFYLTSKILLWIKNCVDVHDFFQPYRGGSFVSVLPSHCFFFLVTHRLVNRLLNLFLMQFLIDLVRTRAISPWGRVVEVPPSHLVMPFV